MNDPLQRWLTSLGSYMGAKVVAVENGWSIDGESERWLRFFNDVARPDEKKRPLVVAPEPSGEAQWLDRLRVVERAAARQLSSAPVGFTAIIAPRKRATKNVVRFAFGFSLSLGARLRQRFTAYLPVGQHKCEVIAGDDGLFARDPKVGPLAAHRSMVRDALPILLAAAAEAQETYRNDGRVTQEIARLQARYQQESRSVETLYTINSGRDVRLLGMETKELKSEDATEAEYIGRLEDLAERYRPQILFEPLSIGLVEGWDG
ncbi:MAG TPA: hypothetical protein VEU30_08140 [Thermoanaerobaculia bacterium]|nr:hypothetical protein [Thermoanaerobaculia bacterium]